MRGITHHIGACLLAAGCTLLSSARAGEVVVLSSGFELHADRHEVAGDTVRLFEGQGVTEVPAADVTEYRAEEYVKGPETQALPAKRSEKVPHALASDPHALIRATVEKNNLPPQLVALLESVVKQESGFHVDAVSPKGAIGLMQLMPATARQFGVDPHDPAQNIEAGTRYFTDLLAKYQDRDDQVLRALAAYNAGPAAVDRYQGIPPYRETRDYVRRIVRDYMKAEKITGE